MSSFLMDDIHDIYYFLVEKFILTYILDKVNNTDHHKDIIEKIKPLTSMQNVYFLVENAKPRTNHRIAVSNGLFTENDNIEFILNMNLESIKKILNKSVRVAITIPNIDAILKGRDDKPTIPSIANFKDLPK